MKFDLSKIKFSKFDDKRSLKLPVSINRKLAEDIGLMIGDGHIGKSVRSKSVDYQIVFSGDSITDRDYVGNYVKNLKKELYGLTFPVSFVGKNKSEIRLKLNSRGLFEFYTKIIGLPTNKKSKIKIPKIVWENKEYLKACLRGIVDTDFSLVIRKNNYPSLKLKTQSKNLVKDCKKAFDILGISTNIQTKVKEIHSKTKKEFITNYLYLSGREKIRKYIDCVGFKNKRNIIKIKNGSTGIRTQDLSVSF